MKKLKLFTLGFLLMLAISSCTVSKQANSMRLKINGNWMLQTINTEGISGKVTATIFNEASFKCFVGSSWKFTSSNSLGSYNINASGTECSSTSRPIRWSVYEPKGAEKEFQFKRLDDKRNPIDGEDGFRLEITELSAGTMQLKSHITFEGKPAAYVYNFIKN